MRKSCVAQKTKSEGLQPESCIGPVGCFGKPQAYGFHHPWMTPCLLFLHSLWKNFNTKLSPISFLWGDISGIKIISKLLYKLQINCNIKCIESFLSGQHSKYFKRLKKNQEETQRNHFCITRQNLSKKQLLENVIISTTYKCQEFFTIFLNT